MDFLKYRQDFEFTTSPLYRWHKFPKDVIPLWVADMDFTAPPAVIKAITKRAQSGKFGYSNPPKVLYDAVVNYNKRKYNWIVNPDEIVFIGGVVAGMAGAILATTIKNDAVAVPKPVYPPFFEVATKLQRQVVDIKMHLAQNRLTYDWTQLKTNSAALKSKLLMFCNPHNPGGAVFTQEEFLLIAELATAQNWLICSDEIHADIQLNKNLQHYPLAKLSQDNLVDKSFSKRLITLMSPNKAYNIPSIGLAYAIISDETIRHKFQKIVDPWKQYNIFALESALACLVESDDWLNKTNTTLQNNLELVINWRNNLGDKITLIKPSASYLVWVKINNPKVINEKIALDQYFAKFGVGVQDGKIYGSEGFIRLNIGTDPEVLSLALSRMTTAIESL